MIKLHPIRHSVVFLALLSAWGCSPDENAEATQPGQAHHVAATTHVRLHGVEQGDLSPSLEAAYAEALTHAGHLWAEAIDKGPGYAASLSDEALSLEAPEATIEHLELRVRLKSRVASRHYRVRLLEHAAVHQRVVSAQAEVNAGPPVLALQAACRDVMAAYPAAPGEMLDVALTDMPVYAGEVPNISPYHREIYQQQCTVYATTADACRQGGGHPRADCSYEDAQSPNIEQQVICYLDQGHWRCDDILDEAQQAPSFPPRVAPAMAAALNDAAP